jgi:hypothetical protein
MITQTEFEKLPKEIQNLRWELFIISDGHRIDPRTDKNEKRQAKILAIIKKLKEIENV